MRLVIDTNIIVSALLSEDSKAFQVLSDALKMYFIVTNLVLMKKSFSLLLFGFERMQFGLKYPNPIFQ